MVAPRAATSTHSMAATQALFVGSLFIRYFDLGGSKRTRWRTEEELDHRFPQDAGQFCWGTSCLVTEAGFKLQAAALALWAGAGVVD
eukprot:11361381-Prorocentrum_lima.AAC.1